MWWEETASGFHFLDGADDPTIHPEGPHLRHYRSTSLKEVTTSTKPLWEQIVERNIDVPSPVILHYDSTGQPMPNEPCDQGSECLADSGHGADSTEAQNNADRHREINPSIGSSLNAHEQSGDSPLKQPSMSFVDEDTTLQPSKEATACYTTKHAQEISKVLGDIKEVQEFDKLRKHIKSLKEVNKVDKIRHQQLLYKLQLQVQHKRTALLEELHSLEQQYFIQHNKLPEQCDCAEHDKITSQCRKFNKLLRAWNIHVN